MKNRNKRFTSVVAASMALAAIAPVTAVFAEEPVSAYSTVVTTVGAFATSAEAEKAGYQVATVNGNTLVFTDPTQNPVSLGGYSTTLVGYVGDLTTSLNISANVNLVVKDANGNPKSQSSKVTAIAGQAFAGIDGLVSVSVPGTVTSIGNKAFDGNDDLTTVAIAGNSSLTIGDYAFANCPVLNSATVSAAASIGQGAFLNDYSLTSFAFPTGLNTIGVGAFKNCTKLATISELPATLTSIGGDAFLNTLISGEIDLPAAVTYVGQGAFATNGSTLYIALNAYSFDSTSGDNWFSPWDGSKPNNDTTNYIIYGTLTEEKIQEVNGFDSESNNFKHYVQCPVVTITRTGTPTGDAPAENTYVTSAGENGYILGITVGQSVEIESTVNGNLYIDGKLVKELNESNGRTYTWNTPAVGEHTVYVENKVGISSKELSVNVYPDTVNYWVKYDTDAITVEYGSVADVDFATPLRGTVTYTYSNALNGTYTTTEPTAVGTYYVKASVAPTDDYLGLDPVEAVQLNIVKAENAWTEELTVTDGVASAAAKFGTVVYTYYDAEGNALDAAPTEPGTYSVVASVAETTNYTGLESEPVEFTIEETNQGWVKNEDGTYSYQDGSEWIMDGIKELPIENGSEETAKFWFVDGVMQKGWYEDNNNKQYYFSSVSGAMLTNRWVSVDAEGNYVDWRTDRDAVAAYYYVDAEGKVVKDVFKYDQACTYGGEADGHYYAFAKDGAMETGFVEHNGKKYYFSPATGIMKTGWAKIDNNWYYFAEDGAMATDETIDGWYVNADGIWVE